MDTFLNITMALIFFILLILFMLYLLCRYIIEAKTKTKNKRMAGKTIEVIYKIMFSLIGVLIVCLFLVIYKEFKVI